jgi:hypothetical protein
VRAGSVLLAALTLTGCVSGSKDEGAGTPQRALAVRPSSLAPVPTDTVAPSASSSAPASGSARPGASHGSSGGPSAAASASAAGGGPAPSGGGAPEAPYHQVGGTTDRGNDAGASTPAYADAVAVTVEDNGPNARITVSMRGDVPARVPSGETIGLGVDFYRSRTQLESDYQVFADGEPDGWYAYLETPHGFVKYPGTFGLGGRRVVFTVPWTSLGGPSAGFFSAFVDWTRNATPANLAGEDHAPDLTNAPYTR